MGSWRLHYLQCYEGLARETFGKTRGVTVAIQSVMDAEEFDRLVARARDPRLISGIYNYCDGRCARCPFTERCLSYLDSQELKAEHRGDAPLGDAIGDSLRRTLEMLAEAARREGIDLDALAEEATSSAEEDALARHRDDRLVARARDYGRLAWRIGRAIAPIAAARDDGPLIEAVETIEWFSSMISSKLYRAVCGQAEGWEGRDDTQTDFNGSAKVALIGIDESRRGWAVLMEAGRATADGVPARAVAMLEELDAAVRERFPRVMAFVRPGFDEVVDNDGAVQKEARRDFSRRAQVKNAGSDLLSHTVSHAVHRRYQA